MYQVTSRYHKYAVGAPCMVKLINARCQYRKLNWLRTRWSLTCTTVYTNVFSSWKKTVSEVADQSDTGKLQDN